MAGSASGRVGRRASANASGIGPFPVGAQQAHVDDVPAPPIAAFVLALGALVNEAALLVRADGAAVFAVGFQAHALQVELMKGEAQGQLHGVAAVAAAPVVALADADAHK